jgi:uncharacterized membrane protein YgcG
MKRFKFIFLFLIVFVLIIPLKTEAISSRIGYGSIDLNYRLNVGELKFTDIVFKDYSDTSSQSFGLFGKVYNGYSYGLTVTYRAYYYDNNHNLIAVSNYSQTIGALQSVDYNQMSNLTIIKSGYTVKDIKHYQLEVTANAKTDVDNTASINNETVTTISGSVLSQNSAYKSYEYVIDDYDVDIKVNENNTFDITENITAYFNVAKHGIFRSIPIHNQITRVDGTTSSNRAVLSNIDISDNYSYYKENGNYVFKIGSSDSTITGQKKYTIKYTYNIGKDPMKNYDELYYNIIGSNWDTVIGNVTFKITMPKKFDSSKLGFASGDVGSTTNNVKYNVDGLVITGSYDGVLNKGQALTVRCELPEGYFVNAGLPFNIFDCLGYVIPIIFVIISFILWLIFGKNRQVVDTVEFYPPAGFNSLEVAYLYKGSVNNSDIMSLLVYLANKGYIKITGNEEDSLFHKVSSFTFTKLKEYDGTNANERIFLNGLFENSSKQIVDNSSGVSKIVEQVTADSIPEHFYDSILQITKNMDSTENHDKIFEKSSSFNRGLIITMIIITQLFVAVNSVINGGNASAVFFQLFFPLIAIYVILKAFTENGTQTAIINGKQTHSPVVIRLFCLFWGLGFGGIPLAMLVIPAMKNNPDCILIILVEISAVVIMALCLIKMSRRTKYGCEILGKINGFKRFLETAEKDNLDAQNETNSTYFYDILPYAYVLGVSDNWINKFENIVIPAPVWYDGSSTFSVVAFGSFINDTIDAASSSVTASSFNDSFGGSFGGSSGGGSSGGGSGGGGGGSW